MGGRVHGFASYSFTAISITNILLTQLVVTDSHKSTYDWVYGIQCSLIVIMITLMVFYKIEKLYEPEAKPVDAKR